MARYDKPKIHIRIRTQNALRVIAWTTFSILTIGVILLMLYNFGLLERWFGITFTP